MAVTYYYCPWHTQGIDPEEQAMHAATFGWVQVPCPYAHPLEAPVPRSGLSAAAWEGVGVLIFCAVLLITGNHSRTVAGAENQST